MLNQAISPMTLYTAAGERKYLNAEERARFLSAALKADPLTKTFCLTLAHSGCRLSETLALSAASVQLSPGILSIQTLKTRRNTITVREVPIPGSLGAILESVHGIRALQQDMSSAALTPLWSWGRTWAWSRVKAVMSTAAISGSQASPKGLRHGFAVHAVHSGVPLNTIQKWLGHALLSTTAIYANPIGPDEIAIAQRMW